MNNNNFDPLELIRRDEERDEKGSAPDRADALDDKRTSTVFRIVVLTLVGIIVFSALYTLMVHPIDKLRTALWIGRSYEIKIFAVSGAGMGDATVKIDKNNVAVSDKYGSTQYYELDGDKIYTYVKNGEEWERVDTGEKNIPIGAGGDKSISIAELLDKKNYERAEGELFEYHARENELGGLKKVKFKRVDGKYRISGVIEDGFYDISITLIFDRIGMTGVTPPWEE